MYDPTSGEQTGERLANNFNAFVTDNYLFTSGAAGIVVRDLANLAVVATMSIPGSALAQMGASRDGRLLMVLAVNTTIDASVVLYDLKNFTRIGEPIHVRSSFPNGRIRPDGLEMAIGSNTGTTIWDLDADHWAVAACALAGRNLTQREWDTYFGWAGKYRKTCPTATSTPSTGDICCGTRRWPSL